MLQNAAYIELFCSTPLLIDERILLQVKMRYNEFIQLKMAYPNVCLVHLYALEGAVENIEFNSLSEEKKKELKEFSEFLKG